MDIIIQPTLNPILNPIIGKRAGIKSVGLVLNNTEDIETFWTKYDGDGYSRASVMNVPDFKGIYREIPIDVIGLVGSRIEINLIKSSCDVNQPVWQHGAFDIISPTEIRSKYTNATIAQQVITKEGHTYCFSFTAKTDSYDYIGNTNNYEIKYSGSPSASTSTYINLYTELKMYYVFFLGKTGGGIVTVGIEDKNSSGFSLNTFYNFKCVDVSSATNQYPPSDALVSPATATITQCFNDENINIGYAEAGYNLNLVKTRVLGNLPKGGACIGDSQVQGQYLSKILGVVMEQSVDDEGLSGYTLQTLANLFLANVDPANQSWCYMEGGVNDMAVASSDPNTAVRAALEKMVGYCKTYNLKGIYCNIAPWKGSGSWSSDRQTWTESFNAWAETYCVDNDIYFIDAYSLLGQASAPEELHSNFEKTSDHIHYNERAQEVLASLVIEHLRSGSTGVPVLTNKIQIASFKQQTNELASGMYRTFTTAAGWSTVTADIDRSEVGIDGAPDMGTVVSDSSTVGADVMQGVFTVADDNQHHAVSIMVKKTAFAPETYPAFSIKLSTGTTQLEEAVIFDPYTGAFTEMSFANDGTCDIWDSGAWWYVNLHLLNNSTGNTYLLYRVYPAWGYNIDYGHVSAMGSIIIDWCQRVEGNIVCSPWLIGGSKTLAPQKLILASAANRQKLIKDSRGAVYVEFDHIPDTNHLNNEVLVNVSGSGDSLMSTITNTATMVTHDVSTSTSLTNTVEAHNRSVVYWSGSKKQITSNENSSSEGTYDGDWDSDKLYLMNENGSYGLQGGMSKVMFYFDSKNSDYWEDETVPGCNVPLNHELIVDNNGNYIIDNDGGCVYSSREGD